MNGLITKDLGNSEWDQDFPPLYQSPHSHILQPVKTFLKTDHK